MSIAKRGKKKKKGHEATKKKALDFLHTEIQHCSQSGGSPKMNLNSCLVVEVLVGTFLVGS